MRNKLENTFYFLTVWFATSVIILSAIGIFIKLVNKLTIP